MTWEKESYRHKLSAHGIKTKWRNWRRGWKGEHSFHFARPTYNNLESQGLGLDTNDIKFFMFPREGFLWGNWKYDGKTMTQEIWTHQWNNEWEVVREYVGMDDHGQALYDTYAHNNQTGEMIEGGKTEQLDYAIHSMVSMMKKLDNEVMA